MKIITKIFLTLLLFSCVLKAQTNLVPNPSFEIHTIVGCPSTIGGGQSPLIDSWNTLKDTPDYFNLCATSTVVATPQNFFGYASPVTGNAYAGFWCYQSTTPTLREIIGAQLISPLVVGQKYYITLNLCRADGDNSNWAIDKTGLRFAMVQHTTSNPPALNNMADVYTHNIIVSTLNNWTTVFGTFVADSTYQFIEIGNFFDNAHTNTQQVWNSGGGNWSYYYVDDVCVSTDSVYSYNWAGIKSINNEEQKNLLYPNPCTNGYVYTKAGFNSKEILIYDMMGNLVRKVIGIIGNKIDLSDLQSGIYFLVINQNNNTVKQKIIISA